MSKKKNPGVARYALPKGALIYGKALADSSLSVFNFMVRLVSGNIDKTGGEICQQSLEAQSLAELCTKITLRDHKRG